MKRYNLMAAAAVFAVTACVEKENFESVKDALNVGNTSLCAVMEGITKATVDQSGKTSWTEGDQVAVYTSASKFETLTLESITDGIAKFTGVVEGTINSGDVVVYPAAAAKSYASETLTVTYPDTYDFVSGCLNTPMIAKVSTAGEEPVVFSHLGGAMSVTFDNVPEWAVKFVFESADKVVTGDFEVAVEPGVSTVSAVDGTAANKVSFTFAKSTKEMNFVIPLPLGTYNKFSVWFEDEEGKIIDGTKINVNSESEINKVQRKTFVAMPEKSYEPWFTVNWVFGDAEVNLPQFRSHVPAIDNEGNVYVLSSGTELYKLNSNGVKQWSRTMTNWVGDDPKYLNNSPVLRRDGTAVYAVGGNAGKAALYGFTSAGDQKFETKQSGFYGGWVRMWQGRIVIGLKNRVFVHANGGRGLHCFNEENGTRICYIADQSGNQLGANGGDGTALSLDGAVAMATEKAMWGTNASYMENPDQYQYKYNHSTEGKYAPYGFKMQHRGWGFKDCDAMAVVRSGGKSYFVRMGANSSAKDPRPHFTSTDKALNMSAPVEKASSSDYFQSLWYHCYQDQGGVIAGADGEAIFTLKANPDNNASPAGIWAVMPSETYQNSEMAKLYSYATLNDVSGSCAIDNNGYIHIIDDKAIYYVVHPNPDTKTCSLVAKADVFELIKSAGKLPDETLGYARTWTSVKLGSDGKIYLNLNMQRGTSFVYGATVCMNFKGTTSPCRTSSWPQEQADPMNSGLELAIE